MTKEVTMNKIEQLSKEAVELGLFLLAGEYNKAQGFAATDRIEAICREIGGSPSELISNCEVILASRQAVTLAEAGN
jgi:hypothetical protein